MKTNPLTANPETTANLYNFFVELVAAPGSNEEKNELVARLYKGHEDKFKQRCQDAKKARIPAWELLAHPFIMQVRNLRQAA